MNKKSLYIGVMSGTSLDGVDTVLVDFKNGITSDIEVLCSYSVEMPLDIKQMILSMCQGQSITLQTLGTLDHRLGLLYSDAINALIAKSGVAREDVIAVGCHGQTVWHQPSGEHRFSMQIGDCNLIAERTNITVVGDFRRRDMACGGQGAPLVPIFHQYLFASKSSLENIAVLNVGGISNITVLPAGCNDGEAGSLLIRGYDTGPGNILMDSWISKCKGEAYDKDGRFAESGTTSTELLDTFLSNEFFSRQPPKSTGRELFNIEWLNNQLDCLTKQRNGNKISNQDVQATLLDLTVESISREIEKIGCQKLIVCGGGAKNLYFMKKLSGRLPQVKVAKSIEYGVDGDLIECLAFAYLAECTINGKPSNVPSVSGASKPSILGAIYMKQK
ncbi:hypothetical protein PPL_12402 [Heterostelium album PN500]|uniref:Anhydro-N-acetylmuramic acid kinase n=1 Tax=Heterostelium pallidum (strain ATCC 26659 / Pp 5 / PN500) TaxID=670386 RepID=D3BMI2_HETP5|nr:hypothetical protein PPL_12402 [Heterostelium album PN500]EFA77194.1 hypothetical protein PPL_12402 [Heterostelium album PN500]|eukprot:XP_020429323.1 hypothetical protein PPL_12402 [Heterostelium album PN500]